MKHLIPVLLAHKEYNNLLLQMHVQVTDLCAHLSSKNPHCPKLQYYLSVNYSNNKYVCVYDILCIIEPEFPMWGSIFHSL